ncbi:MAG: hypothetical protein SFV51_00330 [Bryobacteraceae bacterium]|nr:hypothetical protein [Bryobacteraceae bacterium]
MQIHLQTFSFLMAATIALAQSSSFRINTLGVQSGDAANAAQIPALEDIRGLAVDLAGNIYVSESSRHRVIRITPAGITLTVAGTGTPGFSGDNGPAAAAQLNFPYGLATDTQGNVYVADLGNARIRQISTDGRIRTIAGGGVSLVTTAGATALSVALRAPRNVAVDTAGNVFVSDFEDQRVLRVGVDGRMTIVAGTGLAGAAAESASVLTAVFRYPAGLFVDAGGTLYVGDSANHVIRRISGSMVTTIRVTPTESYVNLPTGVAMDASGNLYVASSGLEQLVRVTPAGVPTVLLAGGVREVAIGAAGTLYCATATQVRRMDAAGQWTVTTASAAVASQLPLTAPVDVQAEAQGGVVVADNLSNRVVRISAAGVSSLVAGSGEGGFSGDNGPALSARLNNPQGVAAGANGVLYISDTLNHRVRRVDAAGNIGTVAGTGMAGQTADTRPGVQAAINAPTGIVVNASGDVYFADTLNHMVRRLNSAGMLMPVAGNGQPGFRGDLAAALSAQLNTPRGLAVASDGSLYVADSGNQRVRKITPQGLILTVAGTGTAGYSGDGGAATDARLNMPSGVSVDASGALYIADTGNQRVRRVTPDGLISTVAGSGTKGFSGDGGPASAANLDSPSAVSAGSTGAVYVADRGNQRIRQLTLDPAATPAGTGTGTQSGDFRVVHAATLEAGPVAPGMLVTILGEGIGPSIPASGKASAAGPLETTVQGTQVLFDGQAAPLLYLQSNMIQAQAPYRISERANSSLQVMREGQMRGQTVLSVTAAAPGVFTTGGGAGPAAALNEDLTVNTEINAAPRGGLVTFFLTGEGALTPAGVEGRLAAAPYPAPTQTLSVQIGRQTAELVSAGAGVSLPGLLQVVARVPRSAGTGAQPLQVTIGTAVTQANVTVYVR